MTNNTIARKLAGTLLWMVAIPALAVVVAARGEGKPRVVQSIRK